MKTRHKKKGRRKDSTVPAEPSRDVRPRASRDTGAPRPNAPTFPVVGVGASAGGLEAFTLLLKALPQDPEMAFVLVSHLDPTHKSAMTELLARATSMQVFQVHDGMRLEPNH